MPGLFTQGAAAIATRASSGQRIRAKALDDRFRLHADHSPSPKNSGQLRVAETGRRTSHPQGENDSLAQPKSVCEFDQRIAHQPSTRAPEPPRLSLARSKYPSAATAILSAIGTRLRALSWQRIVRLY